MTTLYHFTREKNLPRIAQHGLVPRAIGEQSSYDLLLTLGVPAVWLMTHKNPTGWASHYHADTVCLTVNPKRKKLFHWRTWLSETVVDTPRGKRAGTDVLAMVDGESNGRFKAVSEAFYVYFGAIPRGRIQLIEHIEWVGDDEETNAKIREHQETLLQAEAAA